MPASSTDHCSQLDKQLESWRQTWLFGAGISIGAGIPLMVPLTKRVLSILGTTDAGLLVSAAQSELPNTSHIEHILSQIGDYSAIAERSNRDVNIGGRLFSLKDLTKLHSEILIAIAETIRWGYRPATAGVPEQIGTHATPLVKVDDHSQYVRSILGTAQAGIAERRPPIKFFTTNYDTLIEDALALEGFTFWDGFSGGAVAFRNYRYGDAEPTEPVRAHIVKLHGSIDWHLSSDGKIRRVRDRDLFPERTGRVLIYPQSTKYLATQRDPFAAQFDLFRRALAQRTENVLCICGYSFGDDHINQEIALAMLSPDNKTTILAFTSSVGDTLKQWQSSPWQKRLYIMTGSGLYVGSEGPFHEPASGHTLDWWTFAGVTKLLNNGAEACVS